MEFKWTARATNCDKKFFRVFEKKLVHVLNRAGGGVPIEMHVQLIVNPVFTSFCEKNSQHVPKKTAGGV